MRPVPPELLTLLEECMPTIIYSYDSPECQQLQDHFNNGTRAPEGYVRQVRITTGPGRTLAYFDMYEPEEYAGMLARHAERKRKREEEAARAQAIYDAVKHRCPACGEDIDDLVAEAVECSR